ncbi:hypothetical protein H2248_012083 [Termitomyces sp. 'cryptogamus']|nr:hypothetical protein H2248_012083 [Termitomyces sp. 'cryptogamus']
MVRYYQIVIVTTWHGGHLRFSLSPSCALGSVYSLLFCYRCLGELLCSFHSMQRVWSTYLDTKLGNRSQTMDNPSRPASASSNTNSVYSHATSTRHMLRNSNPRNVPFTGKQTLYNRDITDASSVSLTVNYLPSKFSSTLLTPGGSATRKRKSTKGIESIVPKRGGGVDAFKSGESRMGVPGDDDYDNIWTNQKDRKTRLRWNRFKWVLFFANILLTCYSLVALVFCLLTWFNVWHHADIIRVGNRPELILSTIAASTGVFAAIIGWAGILLNNRSFLAVYTFILWIVFAFIVTPGYMCYRRQAFNLDGKINAQWSRNLGVEGRARIQNQLNCCGYFSPFVEATITQTCYARSVLPGCKKPYLDFERRTLKRWFAVAFILVPPQLFVMIAALLCSNHVTYRFGKGMMPKRYRLSLNSMAVIMDNYASQLAERYGADVAEDILKRSKENIPVNMKDMLPYKEASGPYRSHAKYNSLGNS